MIRPLRRAHRVIFYVLAVALPILLALAVAGRRAPTPVNWPASEAAPR